MEKVPSFLGKLCIMCHPLFMHKFTTVQVFLVIYNTKILLVLYLKFKFLNHKHFGMKVQTSYIGEFLNFREGIKFNFECQ
jgi:hypothetical protein